MMWPSFAHEQIASALADQMIAPRAAPPSIAPTFWERVNRSGDGSCWPWTGPLRAGYGYCRIPEEKRAIGAHRVALWIATGVQSGGFQAITRHLCHNKRCCNPDHLLLGSYGDNAWDRMMLARGIDLVAVRREVETRFSKELQHLVALARRKAWSEMIARHTRLVNRRAA
jgi:hypothetical protein